MQISFSYVGGYCAFPRLHCFVEQVFTCPEVATPLHQLQRSQRPKALLKPPPFASYLALAATSPFGQSVGINLRDCLENQPLRLSQPAAPVVDEAGTCRQRLP
jgi:hypothetical protein